MTELKALVHGVCEVHTSKGESELHPYPYIDPNWVEPDETLGCIILVATFVVVTFVATYVDKRKAQRAYEQARLSYSTERLRRIHNCEM